MITLRHHLLTIVAVFAALAVGIVLGAGVLSEPVRQTSGTQERTADPVVQPQDSYPDEVVAALAPTLVAGRLTDRQVALVTMPGADETVVTALVDQVTAAGGSVSGRYDLTGAMVDPGQKSLVDTLGSQLMTQQPGDAVDTAASTYERMGQLLGSAVATTSETGEDVNGKARSITDALAGAELLGDVGEVERRAPLVLVVLGEEGEESDAGSDTILAGLTAGLSRNALGVVVAGTLADGSAADGRQGQLGRLREDAAAAAVATVDGVDTAAGRTATILALQRALATEGGSFGASGSDGAVPLG